MNHPYLDKNCLAANTGRTSRTTRDSLIPEFQKLFQTFFLGNSYKRSYTYFFYFLEFSRKLNKI